MKRNVILFAFCFLLLPLALFAQGNVTIPIDPHVRFGKLDNGLTYYIRHNAYPKDRAEFYIAQNVGSILEEDSQSGLAHFLEHMAFNGTKNFPGRKTMLNYLEENGAKFGEDVNAYTAYDQTVYNLSNIPVTRQGIIDSCLLILHDWSSFISLDNSEIDKERNIIQEEWRTRNNADIRSMNRLFQFAFAGTRYANRMPIGNMDVVMNFPYQALKDYYHKWYRPDLQVIIIVGDIDVDKTEAVVKKMFADIKKPMNPAKRDYFDVPDYTSPKVITITDPETTASGISIYYPHADKTKEFQRSEAGYRQMIMENFISDMLNSRYAEISLKENAPFMGASASNGDFIVVPTKEAWSLSASCKDGDILSAFQALITENERAVRFGFTESELDRQKDSFMSRMEDSYNNRDKQDNSSYVREYVGNFTDNEPIPGIEYEYDLAKRILPTIDLKSVNECIRQLSANPDVLIVASGPQKEGLVYPDNDQLLATWKKATNDKLAAYSDKILPPDLIQSLPSGGKIIKETKNQKLGDTEWTLNNGIRVIIKNTDFQNDQILFSSVSKGGTSQFNDSEILNARFVNNVVPMGGYGDFSVTDLSKMLAGKNVRVSSSISDQAQGFSGYSSKKDLETMFQLLYLKMTQPRKDEEAYQAFLNKLKTQLQSSANMPSTILSDSVISTIYGNNPRVQRVHLQDLDKLNYDRMIEMYKQVFSDPTSQTFTFVGTLDTDSLRPLVEKYLGAFPLQKSILASNYSNSDIRKGVHSNIFNQKMETPKATSLTLYTGFLKRDLKNMMILDITKHILDIMYVRTIRETEGGTYGVSASTSMDRAPYDGRTTLQIVFETDPEKETHLRKLANSELQNIVDNGPAQADFNKAIEYFEKSANDNLRVNDYWLGIISSYYFYGEDYHSDYLKTLRQIQPKDIQNMLGQLLKQKNKIEVVMLPETGK